MYKNKGFGEAKPFAYYARIAEQCTKGDKKSQKLFNKLMREKDPQMNAAMANHMQSIYDNYACQEGSTMIKSTDYEPMNCCLCGARMETIHDTHNPEPLTPRTYAKEALEKGSPNRCCSKCNHEKVMPERVTDKFQKERVNVPNDAIDEEGFLTLGEVENSEENNAKWEKIKREVNEEDN